MHNADFRGSSWGRDGRNLNSNLPAGYREPNPSAAEVEAVLTGVSVECGECGNLCIEGGVALDGSVFCCDACLDNHQWRREVKQKAQAAVDAAHETCKNKLVEAERRHYKMVGRMWVMGLVSVAVEVITIMLAMGWGRW